MKDNFSSQSDKYARFRPTYPDALFDYLLTLVPATSASWDCGTGNGQVANQLAAHFDTVFATDISRQQIDNAVAQPNIHYSAQPAEHTNFPDNAFDLITVAQAIHWFDFDAFYREAIRTLKKHGILAVIGYGRLEIAPPIDAVILEFYRNVIGPYWDKERKYVDEDYLTIPFPFVDIPAPGFTIDFQWTLDHLAGYLETWSAVKHYEKQNGQNPVSQILPVLRKAWGDADTQSGHFPILLRMTHIEK